MDVFEYERGEKEIVNYGIGCLLFLQTDNGLRMQFWLVSHYFSWVEIITMTFEYFIYVEMRIIYMELKSKAICKRKGYMIFKIEIIFKINNFDCDKLAFHKDDKCLIKIIQICLAYLQKVDFLILCSIYLRSRLHQVHLKFTLEMII